MSITVLIIPALVLPHMGEASIRYKSFALAPTFQLLLNCQVNGSMPGNVIDCVRQLASNDMAFIWQGGGCSACRANGSHPTPQTGEILMHATFYFNNAYGKCHYIDDDYT